MLAHILKLLFGMWLELSKKLCDVNQEKLVLVVVEGPNLDTQIIPHITPLLLSIMEKNSNLGE